jgi:hypothetical protein
LAENARMLNLLRDLNLPERLRYDRGVEYVEIERWFTAEDMVLHDNDLALERTKAATWVAHCGGLELRLRPFFFPLFTRVRGRGILRSSDMKGLGYPLGESRPWRVCQLLHSVINET